MYFITSPNSWYDGLEFDSLGEAKAKADDIAGRGFNCDVWAVVDNKAERCIYTPKGCPAGQAIRGAYVKR
jgi:hypothetical protein